MNISIIFHNVFVFDTDIDSPIPICFIIAKSEAGIQLDYLWIMLIDNETDFDSTAYCMMSPASAIKS